MEDETQAPRRANEAPKTRESPTQRPSEQPFPLRRLFLRRFVPAFIGFIGVFLLLIGFTAKHVTESIYLELAQRRAQTIARAVAGKAPEAWMHLMAGRTLTELKDDAQALSSAFNDEIREMNLPELKVYDLERKVIFATHTEEIGTQEDGEALRNAIAHTESEVVTKTLDDGTQQYELYVPVFDDAGHLRAVFELYEPVGYLNAILLKAAVPTMAIPGVLLLLLALALYRLVDRAQADIDLRTDALNELRRRIETFVSAAAVDAARSADASGGIVSRKITTALLYSDVRSFTGFAESNPPEAVVGYLNRIMALQVEAVARHGGDVDKMIGDALLARFDGDDGGTRAVAAAKDICAAMKRDDYPRGLGIGDYRGEVISGAVGPEDRRDFTVIGDTVNIAARLCSAAKAGEIVADAVLANEEFGPPETISVKGRRKPLTVRRFKS